MELNFTKMHGCGNDYIYFNCFETEIDSPESLAVKLSDRHYGVGGDGIILIMRSDTADARMRMFNLDGSEGRMCGNAIRCVAKYLYDNGIVKKTQIKIETLSGIKELFLTVTEDFVSSVRVDMGEAKAKKVTVDGEDDIYVDVGNPHLVLFCDEVDSIDISNENYEKHNAFEDGVNTEFIKVIDKNHLKMRVWERGSGETLACGTGACAAVTAAVFNGYCEKGEDIKVSLLGGDLIINYTDEAVFMTGGCEKVFDGAVEV